MTQVNDLYAGNVWDLVRQQKEVTDFDRAQIKNTIGSWFSEDEYIQVDRLRQDIKAGKVKASEDTVWYLEQRLLSQPSSRLRNLIGPATGIVASAALVGGTALLIGAFAASSPALLTAAGICGAVTVVSGTVAWFSP
jgi:hypothetical protein